MIAEKMNLENRRAIIKKHKPFTRVICKGPKLFKIDGLYISNTSLKQKHFQRF